MEKDIERFDKLIKERMEFYLCEKGIKNLEAANKKNIARALQEFYLKDIAFYLSQFDEESIDDGLDCDGQGDLNIDFACKQDNTYFVFQSKYKGKKNNLTRDEISGFFRIHSRLNDREYFSTYANEIVIEILGDYKPSCEVIYILFTNAKLTQTMIDEFDLQKKEYMKREGSSNITWELKGLSELKEEYERVQSIDEPIIGEVEIPIEKIVKHLSEGKEWAYLDLTDILDSNSPYQTILCTIKGTTLKALYKMKDHKERLFNYNIRGYLGLNSINKKMRDTITENPKSFYLYNNGISAICSKVRLDKDGNTLKLICNNFQIINGAQTTCCIAHYPDDTKLKEVRVLLRITKTEDLKKEKGLNKDIIKYNNSQTIIKDSDFRSNDEIQLFLKNKFPGYTYRATLSYQTMIYLPKRKKISKKGNEVYISMETLAKILYAFNYDPIQIYANTKIFYDTDLEKGKYWCIFGEQNEECAYYSESKTKEIIAITILWLYLENLVKQETKKRIKEGRADTTDYQAYLAKWHFLWAYGRVINTLYSNEETHKKIINHLVDGKIFSKESKTNFIIQWFKPISKAICRILDDEYSDFNSAKKKSTELSTKSFNFKNWVRNSEAFNKLKRHLDREIDLETFPLE